MGSIYLLFEKAIVTRSSNSVLFFKMNEDGKWYEYHKLEKTRGSVYFIRGNRRVQVVTDERVYFYMIDPETCVPTLENVMYNFMNCSVMMFGARVRYSLTYKANQPGIQIYTKKYLHNFKVAITDKNYEGAIG